MVQNIKSRLTGRTNQLIPMFPEGIVREKARKREGERDASVETRLAEAAFLRQNGKDTHIFSRRCHMTEWRGCGSVGGFLLRYTPGKCNYVRARA